MTRDENSKISKARQRQDMKTAICKDRTAYKQQNTNQQDVVMTRCEDSNSER
jgi:hypothetical protein